MVKGIYNNGDIKEMKPLTKDDLPILITRRNNQDFPYIKIEVNRNPDYPLENITKTQKQILENQELCKEIVDLAYIWDEPELQRYGATLMRILKKLEINDVPDFYKQKNINKLIKDLIAERKKK